MYEPAEDSYLLLDTLSSASETAYLKGRFGDVSTTPPLVLEVGVGSGVILAFVAANARTIFNRHDVLTLGDMYVKAEFRAHRDVENPVQIVSHAHFWTVALQCHRF